MERRVLGKRKQLAKRTESYKPNRSTYAVQAFSRYHRFASPLWTPIDSALVDTLAVRLESNPSNYESFEEDVSGLSDLTLSAFSIDDLALDPYSQYETPERPRFAELSNHEKLLKHDFFKRDNKVESTQVESTDEKEEHETKLGSLSVQQHDIYDRCLKEENMFIGGGAGRGKTFLLCCIVAGLRQQGKSVVVLAPTGRAAVNVGGDTLDSFLQVPPQFFKPSAKAQNLAKYRLDSHQRFLPLVTADVFVFDELSMVDRIRFETFVYSVMYAHDNTRSFFGGKQRIGFGDFFQLPPVGAKGVDGRPSPAQFCFQSEFWFHMFPPTNHVELTHSFRQSEQWFVDFLDRLRFGIVTDAEMMEWVERTKQKPEPLSFIAVPHLYGTRHTANAINLRHQQLLQQETDAVVVDRVGGGSFGGGTKIRTIHYETTVERVKWTTTEKAAQAEARDKLLATRLKLDPETFLHRYKAIVEPYLRDELQAQSMIEAEAEAPLMLALSVGSKVMLTQNIPSRGRDWVHGQQGVVTHFESATQDDDALHSDVLPTPYVLFEKTNRSVAVDPVRWSVKYKDGTLTASQLPLEYATAMTIHKSQGSSLTILKTDLSQVFAEGQAYVALSRVRTSEGLYLLDYKPGCVKVHPAVLDFYRLVFPHAIPSVPSEGKINQNANLQILHVDDGLLDDVDDVDDEDDGIDDKGMISVESKHSVEIPTMVESKVLMGSALVAPSTTDPSASANAEQKAQVMNEDIDPEKEYDNQWAQFWNKQLGGGT